jgi:pimeloyl-ACP methyl ester carboxylesterase
VLAQLGGTTISYEVTAPAARVGATGAPAATVVLCSGAGEGPELWNLALGPELVDAGFQIVTYSYRGIAPSSCPEGPITMAHMVNDAIGLVEHLVRTGTVDVPVAVVGYSSGGWVACELARARPDLVACVSTVAGIGRSPSYERLWLRALLEVAASPLQLSPETAATNALPLLLGPSSMQDDRVVESWHRMLAGSDGGPGGVKPTLGHWAAWQEWAEGSDDKGLTELRCPVQIVAFEHDIFLSPAMAEAAAHEIVGADVDLVIVDDCGHLGLFEHSDVVVPAIVSFLLARTADRHEREETARRGGAHGGHRPGVHDPGDR